MEGASNWSYNPGDRTGAAPEVIRAMHRGYTRDDMDETVLAEQETHRRTLEALADAGDLGDHERTGTK